MNAIPSSLDYFQPSHSSAFQSVLSPETLREQVPAIFAPGAHESTSRAYGFISSERVLEALASAGFLPVAARQAARARSPLHARHLIRLRRCRETIALRDSIPELLFLNSHDASSSAVLRCAIFRVVCTNGLVASEGAFPAWRVLHRGNVADDVVEGALRLSERFELLAASVERMERTLLDDRQRLEFAAAAIALRFPKDLHGGLSPSELLVPRRPEDVGNDLWRTLNVIQAAVVQGGLLKRSASNRLIRTRGIRNIGEDLRLNSALWDMAIARAS
jgi:hypothetical protein